MALTFEWDARNAAANLTNMVPLLPRRLPRLWIHWVVFDSMIVILSPNLDWYY